MGSGSYCAPCSLSSLILEGRDCGRFSGLWGVGERNRVAGRKLVMSALSYSPVSLGL